MLESLVKNNLEGWDILVGLECSNVIREQITLLEEYIPQAEVFKRDWPNVGNGKAIGRNGHDIVTRAFDSGSEYNIYLEEDVVVSPDVTNLADWYYEQEEDTMCLCLHNIGTSYQDLQNSNAAIIYPNKECTAAGGGNGFSAYGICMKKDKFFEHMSPYWFHRSGWDWGVWHHIEETKQKVLIPYQTRSDHIGVHGVHVAGPRHLRRLRQGYLEVYQGVVDTDSFYLSKEFRPCDFDPRKRDD